MAQNVARSSSALEELALSAPHRETSGAAPTCPKSVAMLAARMAKEPSQPWKIETPEHGELSKPPGILI